MPPASIASASRRRSGPPCTTRMSRPPNASSMPPSPRASRGSSTSRRSTSSVTRRASPATRHSSRDPADGFVSYYDETKYLAHVATEKRIAAGAPAIIVMPGTTYGPGDHSAAGAQLKAAFDGTARYLAQTSLGISPAHVDDLATGIVAALDRGRLGQSYVMCGTNMRLGEAMAIAATAGGHRLPRLVIPNGVVRLAARLLPSRRGVVRRAPEPPRDRQGIRRRDLLGEPREGDRRARVRAARPRHRCARRFRARLEIPQSDCVVHSDDGARTPDVQPGRWR